MKKFWRAALAAMLSTVLIFGMAVPSYAEEDESIEESLIEETDAEEPVDDSEAEPFLLPVSLGDSMPDFSLELYDGSVFTLSEALETHEVVMINLWGTWCNPCCQEMPFMNEAYELYKDKVSVVCISDADDNEKIREFMEENEYSLPAGFDTIGICANLVTEGYPTNIIVDRFGTYVYYECGSVPDADTFASMFEMFMGDDYTESVVVGGLTGESRGYEAVSDDELSAAICPDGSLTFTTPDDEEKWVFLPIDVYLEQVTSDGSDEPAEETAESDETSEETEEESEEALEETDLRETEEAETEESDSEEETEESGEETEESEIEEADETETEEAEEEAEKFIGVINSNCGALNTNAVMNTKFEAAEGDVFAFDYICDTELIYDGMYVIINDETVRYLTGTCSGTYVYIIPEDGTYTVELVCSMDGYESALTDSVILSNAVLASGEAAEDIIASMPDYPKVLEGKNLEAEILTEGAKEIVFSIEDFTLEDAFGPGSKAYIIPGGNAEVRLSIGDEVDPYAALAYGDYDYEVHVLSECEYDEIGFLFDCAVSSVEAGGYNNTYLGFYVDADTMGMTYVLFLSEENVNHFCYEEGYCPAGWKYADGTEPATDEVAVYEKEPLEVEEGMAYYVIKLVDENGDLLEDTCLVNVCTDETCNPGYAENGIYEFTAEPYPYIIHVLTVPEGYEFDVDQDFIMNEEGGELEITIPYAK